MYQTAIALTLFDCYGNWGALQILQKMSGAAVCPIGSHIQLFGSSLCTDNLSCNTLHPIYKTLFYKSKWSANVTILLHSVFVSIVVATPNSS